MTTGSSAAYFHHPESGESRARHDVLRDRASRLVSSWTAVQNASAHRAAETERFGYVESREGPVANLTSLSFAQTSQRTLHTDVHLHATTSVSFPARTGHVQVHHAASGAARRSSEAWNSFCDSQAIGDANAPRPGIAEASPLCFTDPAWEDLVTTPFVSAPRVHPPPLQGRSWEASEAIPIQPPSLINNDVSSLEPITPQNVDEDQDAYTFLCEWTDENGTCSMEILGDRVWMSHHLSRQHNVVGHERSQRACLWRGCADTMNKGSLARHIVSRHLRAGATCGFCSKVYSRADVARRHTKKCKVANGALGLRDQTK